MISEILTLVLATLVLTLAVKVRRIEKELKR